MKTLPPDQPSFLDSNASEQGWKMWRGEGWWGTNSRYIGLFRRERERREGGHPAALSGRATKSFPTTICLQENKTKICILPLLQPTNQLLTFNACLILSPKLYLEPNPWSWFLYFTLPISKSLFTFCEWIIFPDLDPNLSSACYREQWCMRKKLYQEMPCKQHTSTSLTSPGSL